MGKKDLEQAILFRLTDGTVTQKVRPTRIDVKRWIRIGKGAHAIANGAKSVSLVLSESEDLGPDFLNEQIQKLRARGWKGKTMEDFRRDYQLIKNSMKNKIPAEKWREYFS